MKLRVNISPNLIIWTIFFVLQSLFQLLHAKEHVIYWNATNPIFRIDNTLHVIKVRMFDKVIIKCPYIGVGQEQLVHKDQIAFSRLYRASWSSYERCELSPATSQQIGVCKRPNEQAQLNLVIRPFTPLPGGLEFTKGKSYYFVSTSTGRLDGMTNRQGGLCETSNMKLILHVLYDEEDPKSNTLPEQETTPLMYIVHTRPSYQYDYDSGNTRGLVTRDDDYYDEDGGGAACVSAWSTIMLISIFCVVFIGLDIRL